jgi:hypothetical protein
MAQINLWAVLVAALSAFMLGGLWYSPVMFTKAWQEETGVGCGDKPPKHKPAFLFGMAFLLSLVSAFVFAMFLGPRPPMPLALGAGLGAGLGWVATSFGINYLFEEKSFRLFYINAGYHAVQFLLYGLVFGLMQ